MVGLETSLDRRQHRWIDSPWQTNRVANEKVDNVVNVNQKIEWQQQTQDGSVSTWGGISSLRDWRWTTLGMRKQSRIDDAT